LTKEWKGKDAMDSGEITHQDRAIWKTAEDAVRNGDDVMLERLLRENPEMFRKRQPPAYHSGGLSPEYSGADARAIIVKNHEFENWEQFAAFREALGSKDSPVAQFEAAVEAIVTGDLAAVEALLGRNPELVRKRSTRKHRATLLHYAGANGVEGFRQRTPKNAVEITELLLKAGADVNAVADLYGGATTLGLVATSIHPLQAGVQEPLMEMLLDHGAALDGAVAPNYREGNIINSCLANGRGEAAEFLAKRGAKLDLEGAAGIGQLDEVKRYFDEQGCLKTSATEEQLKDGFAWACEFGRTAVVDFLLKHGVGVDTRLRHDGQTGLHWAAYSAHPDTIQLLIGWKAAINLKDQTYNGTPLGWALYAWGGSMQEPNRDRYCEAVALLVSAGGTVEREWLQNRGFPLVERIENDPGMCRAIGSDAVV
jgi:ankyrin repeat protein